MSERIYSVKRKITVEGEDQEQPSLESDLISHASLRLIIGIFAVVALVVAVIAIGLN
jgi:hypothetical protein